MLRNIFVIGVMCCVLVTAAVSSYAGAAPKQEIVAVVNEDAISASDLNKRMKLILASSGLPDNPEIRSRLTRQVVNTLVEEQLMLQEGRRLELVVLPEEIEDGFASVAQQNNMSADEFKAMLTRGGIDLSTLRHQIEAQTSWMKVVQSRLRPRVVISDMDVDDGVARIKAKIGTTEYLVAEIFLPVDEAHKESEARALASRLLQEVKSGKASFFKLAQQFSKAAGAARGGDAGWMNETQLSSEVLEALRKIQNNQVSEPVKSLTGYHIFFLRDKRTLTEDTMPSREQVYYNIGTERLERLQRRHLLDLKTSSFVDIRV